MDQPPPGTAEIRVRCEVPPYSYDLAFYGSDFVVPGWWLGVADGHGDLLRTSFLPSPGGLGELLLWLEPFTGIASAESLVRLAQDAVS
jgi:hypothetical protein